MSSEEKKNYQKLIKIVKFLFNFFYLIEPSLRTQVWVDFTEVSAWTFPKKTSPRVGVEGWGTTSTVCTEAVTTARCPAWPPNCRFSSLWALNLSLNPPNILPSGLSAHKYSYHWALSPKHFWAFGHSTTQYFLAKQSTFQIFWTLGVWPQILKVLNI